MPERARCVRGRLPQMPKGHTRLITIASPGEIVVSDGPVVIRVLEVMRDRVRIALEANAATRFGLPEKGAA